MAPSHCLNQCWNFVDYTLRNKFQWTFNRNSYILSEENAFENYICEMFCFSFNVLTHWDQVVHIYIHQSTIPSLVQKMAWCQSSAKFTWPKGDNNKKNFHVQLTTILSSFFCRKTSYWSFNSFDFMGEKLHECFSTSAVFQRKIERINRPTRHVLL